MRDLSANEARALIGIMMGIIGSVMIGIPGWALFHPTEPTFIIVTVLTGVAMGLVFCGMTWKSFNNL